MKQTRQEQEHMWKKRIYKILLHKTWKEQNDLWLEDVFKIGVEQIKGYESPMSYLYFLGELVQLTFDLVQLLVDWKWIKNELGVN
jgi:hypothetical protein